MESFTAWLKQYRTTLTSIAVFLVLFIGGVYFAKRLVAPVLPSEEPEEVLETEDISDGAALRAPVANPGASAYAVTEETPRIIFGEHCAAAPASLGLAIGERVLFRNGGGEDKEISVQGASYQIPVLRYRTHAFKAAGSYEVSCNGAAAMTIVVS